jgi:hypothetical protein
VGGPATTDISIKPQTKHALVSKFGSKKGINVTLRANGFYGGSIDALTEAEAQRMLKFNSDKDLEDALQIEIEKELPPNKDPNLDDRQYVRKARGLVWWEKLSAANENAISTYRRGLKDRNRSVRNVLLIEGTLNGEKLSIETPSGEKYAKGIRSPRNYETVEVGHDRRFDSEPNALEPLTDKLKEFEQRTGRTAEGSIEIISSNKICESCQGVLEMFQQRFPKVKVKIKAETNHELHSPRQGTL